MAKRGRKKVGRFRSQAQWRYFFSNPKLKKYAHKWAHATPGGPKVRYRRLPKKLNKTKHVAR